LSSLLSKSDPPDEPFSYVGPLKEKIEDLCGKKLTNLLQLNNIIYCHEYNIFPKINCLDHDHVRALGCIYSIGCIYSMLLVPLQITILCTKERK
jgi:hypothetical protein